MRRKGQAAMEFLMTYGWAILAAVVVIGVLAYFGVFSPGRYVPSACVANAPFSCDEYNIQTDGVHVILRNGAGEAIDLHKIEIGTACLYDASVSPVAVADGAQTAEITVACTLTSGSRFNEDMTITYRKAGGTLDQTATGSVRGTVA